MREETIYEERIWLNPWLTLLMGIMIGAFSIIGLVQLFYGIPIGRRPESPVLYFGVALLFVFVYLNFSKLDIDINTERIEVRYGLVKKVIPMKEIVSYEPHFAGFYLYGGIGIRRGVDGSLAFTTSFGNSMKIHMRSGRPFVFSTNKPYEIVKTLSSFIDGV
ncbi:hypothetical protein GH157_06450 [archaeon]|nr:hypothetical protein [archaeon]